jgi:HNH/ENDO VII superfamily nuclease
MMLVPTDLHSQVAHTGGMARYRDITGGIGYDH